MSERIVSIEWWCQGVYNGKPEAADTSIFPYIELVFDSGVDEYRAVRLWEQSAEHSKLVPVLQLMGPVWDDTVNDTVCYLTLTEGEVFDLLGWNTIPTEPITLGGRVEIGPVWDCLHKGGTSDGRNPIVIKPDMTWQEWTEKERRKHEPTPI